MLIIFFDIKEIVHKEFALAGQTVNSAYCCDILRRLRENVRKLLPELWRQMNWLLHHDNAPSHTSFSSRDFDQKLYECRPHHLYFPLFLRLKIKLKDIHFDTSEVIEAEL
jgi:hypothetical protein